MTDASGQWRDSADGTIVHEPSKRVEIVLPGMADDDSLEAFQRFDFTDPQGRWTRPVYRRGTGPAVIVPSCTNTRSTTPPSGPKYGPLRRVPEVWRGREV